MLAPWTAPQVGALWRWQKARPLSSAFKCPRHGGQGPLLVPFHDGWQCQEQFCRYGLLWALPEQLTCTSTEVSAEEAQAIVASWNAQFPRNSEVRRAENNRRIHTRSQAFVHQELGPVVCVKINGISELLKLEAFIWTPRKIGP